MFADPTSIIYGTTTMSLPRVSVGDMKAVYRSADGALTLDIGHTDAKRERSVVRLTTNKVGADPFNSSITRPYKSVHYFVSDTPSNGIGFTDAEITDQINTVLKFLSVPANLAKFIGKES